MPQYIYACRSCEHEFEVYQGIKEESLKKCPECAEMELHRVPQRGGQIEFKGEGFYETDSSQTTPNKFRKGKDRRAYRD